MDKAPDAFRTISEVAADLDIPQHVLRFWETRFSQIKPMKRSGGRRYYRPDDVDLLRGIRRLLYGEGYTIRGVQRILKAHGVKSVQRLADATATPSFGAVEEELGRSLAEPGGGRPMSGIDLDDDDYEKDDLADDFPVAPPKPPALKAAPAGDDDDEEGDGPIPGVEYSAHPFDVTLLEGLLQDLIACRQMLDAAMDDR